MFSNILGGAAGFPVADLGDDVNQSLRFSGGQNLRRTFGTPTNRNTWTVSLWLKRGTISSRQDFFTAGMDGLSNATLLEIFFGGSDNFTVGKASVTNSTPGRYRDPSAWYHLVIVNDGTDIEQYVNSVLVSTWSGQGGSTGFNNNKEHSIGDNNYNSQAFNRFNGYMAAFYFVDGQALDPDNFGRSNEDGVWVPEDYTGTYGNNGFHLDFADSSNPGNDVSGNNNDFTASGFDTTSLSQRSHQCFGDNTSTYNSSNTNKIFLAPPDASIAYGPSRMFDGDLVNTQCKSGTGTAQTWIYYRPDPALSVSSSLGINCSQTQAIRINGVDQSLSNTSQSTLNVSSPPASVTEIAIQGNTISSATVFGIIVDGTVLTDNLANDVDYKDTPTSNFSTYNPRVNNDEPTFSQGNLDGDSFNNGIAWASQELPNEHLYCEFVKTAGDHFAAGVWDSENDFEKGAANDNDYAFGIVYSELGDEYRIYNENTTATQTGLARYYTGGVLGVEWRGDLATRQVNFYIDGTQVGSSENVAAGGNYYFGAHRAGGSTGPSVEVNFGQRPFVAAPTGISNTTHGMQTNNLPEPTIKNGSDHFRALTGSGANILAIAQGTNTNGTNWNSNVNTGFTDGLWWIKDRVNNDSHQLIDSVTVADVGSNTCSISPQDNGSAGSGFRAYSAPSGNSVAWCWNYNSADPTQNGFEIIRYTGNSTQPRNLSHNLGVAPEFILFTSRSSVTSTGIPMTASFPFLGSNTSLLLGSNAQAYNPVGNTTGGVSAASSTTITLNGAGNADGCNANNNDYTVYLWNSVEGYSKIGSYTGVGNADGAFVYTGFRPAFVLIKLATASGGSWSLHDSTRDTHNPADTDISPNSRGAEGLNSFTQIDMLSNGFKITGESGTTGQSGATLVYAAFAESPFGGENAAPATAR